MPNRRPVYLFSDATGETGARALRVALEQYPGTLVVEHMMPQVRTAAEIAQIIHAAAETGGFVVFTLADEYLRKTAHTAATELHVIAIDLLGPLLSGLEKWLGTEPRQQPGHPYDPTYFGRMKAFDYVTRHDDGKNPAGLGDADVVILGLSRTGKSPLCRMLAEHRIHAANVPIVPSVSLPPQIGDVDPRRVYVLTMHANRLAELRTSRASNLSAASTGSYTDRDAIRADVRHVQGLLATNPGWTSIDVTRTSVEEVASGIRRTHNERFPSS